MLYEWYQCFSFCFISHHIVFSLFRGETERGRDGSCQSGWLAVLMNSSIAPLSKSSVFKSSPRPKRILFPSGDQANPSDVDERVSIRMACTGLPSLSIMNKPWRGLSISNSILRDPVNTMSCPLGDQLRPVGTSTGVSIVRTSSVAVSRKVNRPRVWLKTI